MNTQIDRLGKVSITVEKDYWDITKCYDRLVVVEKENDGAYLSRKPVPAGTSIYFREYWIKLCSGQGGSSSPILEVSFSPQTVNVNTPTQVTITIQISAIASQITIVRNGTTIDNTGSGTNYVFVDEVNATNTDPIYYQIEAIVNNQTVGKVFALQVNQPAAPISWATDNYSYTIGDANPVLPALNNIANLPVTYDSTNTNVITVNSQTGEITLVGAGSTIIRAIFAGNSQYQATTAQLNVVVHKAVYSDLSWRKNNVVVTYQATDIGMPYIQPVLYNPLNKPVVYSSSNPNIATIDSNGTITRITPGICNIVATFNGDDEYAGSIASFQLTVTQHRENVYIGAGIDYNSVEFFDTESCLTDNMVVEISTNDGDYIFIKVGENDDVTSFRQYAGSNSPFNYVIPLEAPVNDGSGFKYYKTSMQFRQLSAKYIINQL